MLKTYYIKTFGCQMNYADSEKIDMILRSAGFRKVIDPVQADIVICNTCSVRQKGEDRVFGFIHEIEKYHEKVKNEEGRMKNIETKSKNSQLPTPNYPLFGITGCMVRKSGLAKRYLGTSFEKEVPKYEAEDFSRTKSPPLRVPSLQKRVGATKISLLGDSDALTNYDDELFLRSQSIDFVFRIEEVAFLTKILSLITHEDIGNDAKFNEYLAVRQLQENPASANIIIQTGCDNFCTFCIVPHTRGREISRDPDEIVAEIREVVKNGTREVTLLGQNVNSYGKETKGKLWNSEEMKWFGAGTTTPALRATPSKEGESETVDTSGAIPLQYEGVPEGRGSSSENTRSIDGVLIDGGDIRYKNIPYNPLLRERARELRQSGNLPEVVFWNAIKQGQFYGFDFDRQKIIGNYIADFYSKYLGLIIEIDGSSHEGREEHDAERDAFMAGLGLKIMRIGVNEVMHNLGGVLDSMKDYIVANYGITTPALRATLSKEGESGTVDTSGAIPLQYEGVSSRTVAGRGSVFQTPFRELLEKISEIEGLDRIRFTSSNPHDMTLDILSAHFDLPHMTPHLHFALQSGSDSMLRRMNRKHTYADFKSQVDYLRSRDPLFSISTDIIVGFPGETEEEFQATVTAMRECQFDVAFIARYSARTGTTATNRFEDDISPGEKARRWTILNDILRETAQSRNLLMVGRIEEILISGEGKDETWVGRTRNFKEVFIPKFPSGKGGEGDFPLVKIGDLVKVKITEGDKWVLKGERV